MTWIEWFLSLPGNQCLCEIPYKQLSNEYTLVLYIDDSTFCYGLNKVIDNYEEAFNVIIGNTTGSSKTNLIIIIKISEKGM